MNVVCICSVICRCRIHGHNKIMNSKQKAEQMSLYLPRPVSQTHQDGEATQAGEMSTLFA